MKKLLLITVIFISGCAGYNEFNPSPEAYECLYSGLNDFQLCDAYLSPHAVLRSKEFRYRGIKKVVSEVMKRKLNCNFFPELASKEPYMEDWIKEYEQSLEE